MRRPLGDVILPDDCGPKQTPSNPATMHAVPPIQVRRWARNGSHPNASLESLKAESLNQAALYRTKTYFQCGGVFEPPLSLTTDYFRFAFRSGPFAHAAYVSCVLASPNTAALTTTRSAVLRLYTTADESVLLSSTEFFYGYASSAGSWRSVRVIDKAIDVTPNTDYYALLRRVNNITVLSATAFELASLTQHNAGYLPQNVAAHQPIVDTYRQLQSSVLQQLWNGTASPVFQWTVQPGQFAIGAGAHPYSYLTVDSATPSNILDYQGPGSYGSTAVNANTPGFWPDMSNMARRSQLAAGIPCVMKAFGWYDRIVHPTTTGGVVQLKDSTGAVLATITGWGTTPEWRSVNFNLPATNGKLDVHFSTAAGPGTVFHLWAVSVYPVG